MMDASSEGTCWYACARSNLEKIFPPSKDAKMSSIHGRGYTCFCGIRDRCLQQRLLAETDLTFQKALDISQAIEAAERNARDLQAKQQPILALNQPTR